MAVSLHISLLARSISYSRGSGVVPESVKPANPYGKGKEIIAMNEWFPDALSIPSGGKRRPRVVLVEESCADAMSGFFLSVTSIQWSTRMPSKHIEVPGSQIFWDRG